MVEARELIGPTKNRLELINEAMTTRVIIIIAG
jgi:hypothetical protein